MGRDTNIEIFKDTENLVKKNPILKEAVAASTRMQKVILETENVGVQFLNRYAKDASVIVSKKRTFDAAAAYRGKKLAVLNFASASNPGGGVTKGSSAQEECFPVTGPILIITDGMIEHDLKIKREHAFLLPKGNKLPFHPKGKVFYFKE